MSDANGDEMPVYLLSHRGTHWLRVCSHRCGLFTIEDTQNSEVDIVHESGYTTQEHHDCLRRRNEECSLISILDSFKMANRGSD